MLWSLCPSLCSVAEPLQQKASFLPKKFILAFPWHFLWLQRISKLPCIWFQHFSKHGTNPSHDIITHRIHVLVYLFTYIWLMLMVNVGKYTIHGSYGLLCFLCIPHISQPRLHMSSLPHHLHWWSATAAPNCLHQGRKKSPGIPFHR